MAPEAPGKTAKDLILYASNDIRQNAGRIESWFIELTADTLKKAGVPIPGGGARDPDNVDTRITSFGDRLKAGKRFSQLRADLLHQEIDVDHQQYAQERTNELHCERARRPLDCAEAGAREREVRRPRRERLRQDDGQRPGADRGHVQQCAARPACHRERIGLSPRRSRIGQCRPRK